MQTIVVGGHTRNIGKTSVMAGLIRNLKSFDWTAVKITQYGHGMCSMDGEPCGCAPTEHAFVLTEETDSAGGTDTCRFLAAGAKRSLWLRARQGQLAEAFPILDRALAQDECVMIESNSILSLVRPLLYLVVLDTLKSDFKPSALEFLDCADALAPVGSLAGNGASAWPPLARRAFENKPRFPVSAGDYFSAELCRFVRQKLLSSQQHHERDSSATLAPAISLPATEQRPTRKKEQPCPH